MVKLLRPLALASVVGAWLVIMVGGYTTTTGSGLGCRSVIDCGETPLGPGAAAVETAHRIVAWVEGLLVLALLVVVLRRHREWRPVRNLTFLAFALIVAQGALGMASVAAGWGDIDAPGLYPVLVTAHLGLATAFLAVTVLNAAVIFWGAPPAPPGAVAPVSARPLESG